ncbi:MAG: Uma2 family endonuclease [Pyrinomonadaceae bacterium]
MVATITHMHKTLLVVDDGMSALNFAPLLKDKIGDEEYVELCRLNPEWRIEMTAEGDIIIMPPTGGTTGNRNFNLVVKFGVWSEKDGTGKGFDSSTVFRLPNGAKRSPDLSWIRNERWNALSEDEKNSFAPICPDFVVELRSITDSLKTLQAKMREYIENGAQLGWLIDPFERKVYVSRPNAAIEILDDPQSVSGEPLLKDFTLNLQEIWD